MPDRGRQDTERFEALSRTERDECVFQAEMYESILRRRPGHEDAMVALADTYTRLGYYQAGLELDRELCRRAPRDPARRYNLACSFALLGRTEDAFEALEAACDLGWRDRVCLARDPDLESLHDDPRFAELIRNIHPPMDQEYF